MQYLVRLKLPNSMRPKTTEDGIILIEKFILPTLERSKELVEKKKILAGGPVSGAIEIVLIVSVESPQELEEVIASLPMWSRTETEVIPLNSFEGRALALAPRLEQLKAQFRDSGGTRVD